MKFRLIFAILGCIGMAIIYGFKVNLSVAIVAMVNQTAIKDSGSHHDVTKLSHVTSNLSADAALQCHSKQDSIHDKDSEVSAEIGHVRSVLDNLKLPK